MTANIRLMPHGDGIEPGLFIPLPALDVVTTTLVVSSDASRLPTLSSVERIVSRLANLGLVLAHPREGDRIAGLVNKKFLPLEQENWKDQDLLLKVARADGEGAPEALRAVGALRTPVLKAADVVITSGGAYGPVERRANEIRLVDELSQEITTRKPVWLTFGGTALEYIGRSVLDQLVDHLIGVPISDLIRSTVKGTARLVF